MFNVDEIRKEFPILKEKINGKDLCYLDNGASAQKPRVVIDSMVKAYELEYANVHRGLHHLSNLATENFEIVREKIRRFLGAKSENEIVFTSGSTEALNLVSYSWGINNLRKGDEIILSVAEHHSNIVPWHFLRERQGVVLKWVEPREDGQIHVEDILLKVSEKTKMIAITHMSNVLGCIVDIKRLCIEARKRNIVTVVDGSQAAVHMPINVYDLDCDFYAITGHKLYGPSSSGALFVAERRFDEMIPFHGGGAMIKSVTFDSVTYNTPPLKFEAGTPGIVPMIGFGAALDFMTMVGIEEIHSHEESLRSILSDELRSLDYIRMQGDLEKKGAIFSFIFSNQIHPHDVATIVDQKGVAIRAGHHCCEPLMKHYGVGATCRASFAMYNTVKEIEVFLNALRLSHELLS